MEERFLGIRRYFDCFGASKTNLGVASCHVRQVGPALIDWFGLEWRGSKVEGGAFVVPALTEAASQQPVDDHCYPNHQIFDGSHEIPKKLHQKASGNIGN